MREQLLFLACLHSSLFIWKRKESKARLHVIINSFCLHMAHVVNHRDLRQKCFNDKYLDEWEITMNGSGALQTLSCWTVIPFPPNTGLSNSIGISLNSKVSLLLVWSQAAKRGGREGKVVSGTSAISKSCPFLADTGIVRWKWRST